MVVRLGYIVRCHDIYPSEKHAKDGVIVPIEISPCMLDKTLKVLSMHTQTLTKR